MSGVTFVGVMLIVLGLLGLAILFLIGEIHAYQRWGNRNPACTYAWVRKIYEKYRLDRIRW